MEILGEPALGDAVALQGATDRGLVRGGLGDRGLERQFGEVGQQECGENLMLDKGVESFPKSPAGNLLLQLVGPGLDLPGPDPPSRSLKRPGQLGFIKPARIHLLLIIPAMRGKSAEQICQVISPR